MNNIKLKKNDVVNILKDIQNLEKSHKNYLQKRSILEICDVKITPDGFSVLYPKNIPDNLLNDISKLLDIYALSI